MMVKRPHGCECEAEERSTGENVDLPSSLERNADGIQQSWRY